MGADRLLLGRRSLLLGVGAVATTTLIPGRARAGGPQVLVLGGSSIKGALGKLIEERLQAVGYATTRHAKSASGLARPDFFDWPNEGKKLQQQVSPAATVLNFGGNDGQGLWMGKDADPQWIRWGQPGWDQEYQRRIRAMAEAVAPSGQHVFWLGMPIMRSPKLAKRVQHMNELAVAALEGRTHAHYVDTWPLLSDGRGNYAETKKVGGKTRKVRAPDGVHLSPAGAGVIADHLATVVHGTLPVG